MAMEHSRQKLKLYRIYAPVASIVDERLCAMVAVFFFLYLRSIELQRSA